MKKTHQALADEQHGHAIKDKIHLRVVRAAQQIGPGVGRPIFAVS
jgi:hypothetical protein